MAAGILFFTLMVSVQTPLGQLLKLPLLVEHFLKHRQQTNISLLDFLGEHYATDHRDADLPEDEQLPFKTSCNITINAALVTPHFHSNLYIPSDAEKKMLLPGRSIPQQDLCSVFHPPRML